MNYYEVSEMNVGIKDSDQLEKWEGIKERFMDMMQNNPKLKKVWDEYEADVKEQKESLQKKFEESKVFYRGTSIEELDSILNEEFEYSDESKYEFRSLSMNEQEVKSLYNFGIILEYEGDDIREKGKLVDYKAEPTPYLHANPEYHMRDFDLETVDSPYPAWMIDEEEVRVDNYDMEGVKVKKLTIDLNHKSAYAMDILADQFGITNFKKEWQDSVRDDIPYKQALKSIGERMKKELLNSDKFKKFAKELKVVPYDL